MSDVVYAENRPDSDPCPSCGEFWSAGQPGLDTTGMLVDDHPCQRCREEQS